MEQDHPSKKPEQKQSPQRTGEGRRDLPQPQTGRAPQSGETDRPGKEPTEREMEEFFEMLRQETDVPPLDEAFHQRVRERLRQLTQDPQGAQQRQDKEREQ